MGSKKIALAAVLMALTTGCATVNYHFKGKSCEVLGVSEDNQTLVLKCPNPERAPEREWLGRTR